MGKSNSTVNKVGGNQKPNDTGKKEKPKGRIDFPKKTAMYRDKAGQIVTALNAENLLIAVPATISDADGRTEYAGYDSRKHKPLKKSDFVSMANYLQFQGYTARLHAAKLVKIAEDKEAKASRLLKFGDEQTRKKAAKVAKMRDQLAALEKQLTEEGIDVKDI